MKKTAKRKALSIAAGVLFLLAAIFSLLAVSSTNSVKEAETGRYETDQLRLDEDCFYENAVIDEYVRFDENGSEWRVGYRIGYWYYEDYDDYVSEQEELYEENCETLDSAWLFLVVLTVAFILSGLGAFTARKKPISVLFIVGQAMVFLTTIFTLISFSDGESDQTAVIVIYVLLALLCTSNYIIPLFKPKSKAAAAFIIPILVNIILIVLPAFFFIAMLNIDDSIVGLLVISYIPAIIAFLLYCSSVRTGYKVAEASERTVQQANYEVPTQYFTYDCQQKPIASSHSPSAADELKKYKELLDMGVITQEDFDAKKKQLLDL